MLPTPDTCGLDTEKVYDPAEDSFLLLDLFESLRNELSLKHFEYRLPLVVEIGTGSGIVTTFINKNILPDALYIATDINPYSCKAAAKTNASNATSSNFDVIRCSLTTALRYHQIDILIFNPPYVPTETIPEIPKSTNEEYRWLDIALNGGPDGMDITNKVLDSLDHILSDHGEAYTLFCARNKPQLVAQNFQKLHSNFKVTKVITKKAGWEVLSVYKFAKI